MALIAVARNQRAALRFASREMLSRVIPQFSWTRQLTTRLLLTASLVVLVVCLTDMRWGEVEREVPQRGIEVMFLLDVSRSMLAEDVAPNRLERAKQMIKDTIDEMAGDRVGLTVFSGEARQRIPLTNHYADFKQTLDEVTPEDLYRGGSRLGDALTEANNGFHGKTNRQKAIVLISDGEDQDSSPLEVANRIHKDERVRIVTIGLGDSNEGARIPINDRQGKRYLEYEGQQVWSKLNGEILQQIAEQTEGIYIPAETKQVPMADVYNGYLAKMEQSELETATINAYEARYQWFCCIALLLLLTEIFVATRYQ